MVRDSSPSGTITSCSPRLTLLLLFLYNLAFSQSTVAQSMYCAISRDGAYDWMPSVFV